MHAKHNRSNLVLAGVFAISLGAGIVTVASMGTPADITSEPLESTQDNATASVVPATTASASTADYDTPCLTPSEDSTTAHCTFIPASRYDYVGARLGQRAGWYRVDDDARYASGNRPPTGQYLTDHPEGEDN